MFSHTPTLPMGYVMLTWTLCSHCHDLDCTNTVCWLVCRMFHCEPHVDIALRHLNFEIMCVGVGIQVKTATVVFHQAWLHWLARCLLESESCLVVAGLQPLRSLSSNSVCTIHGTPACYGMIEVACFGVQCTVHNADVAS